MKWMIKALVKQVLSYCPGGEDVDYYLQRRVTHSLPTPDPIFLQSVKSAKRHFSTFLKYKPNDLETRDACFYEFGAGWMLSHQLTYYFLGIRHQTIIDIRPNLKLDLVNHSLEQFSRVGETRSTIGSTDIPVHLGTLEDLRGFGINYQVRDARHTGLPSESIDFISSSSTLQHVPRKDLLDVLKECRRLLRRGGILSCGVSAYDHYSDFDKSIGPHHFLRYSDLTWRLFNPPLHHQNRLRACDYKRLIEEAGFTVLQYAPWTKGDRAVKIHPSFAKRYEEKDMMFLGVYIVGGKG